MELFIQLQNGKPYEHPILAENLVEAYPDFDTSKLPKNFARFERVDPPELGPYELLESSTYQFVGDIVKDFYTVRQMTSDEKKEKQSEVKKWWADIQGAPSWIFNEASCTFIPPVSYPTDGENYEWNEATKNWVEVKSD